MRRVDKLLSLANKIPPISKCEDLTEEQLESEIERLQAELEIGNPTLKQLSELITGFETGRITFERYNEIIISAGGKPRSLDLWLEENKCEP